MITLIIELSVALGLWTAVFVCLPSALRGQRRHLTCFLAVFAVAMTLQPRPIYAVVDEALGSINITYFLFHALTIVTVAILDPLIQVAVSPTGLTRRRAQSTVAMTSFIIAAQSALFFGRDWRYADDLRTASFSRWDFTLYSATTWVTLLIFSVSVALACVADLRRQHRPVTRASLAFIVVGCGAVLVYAVTSLINARYALVDPDFGYLNWSRPIYLGALLTAPLCLAVGLGLTAASDGLRRTCHLLSDRVLLHRITPLWERLTAGTPELSIDRHAFRSRNGSVQDTKARLYRRHIEIRDSLLLGPDQTLTTKEFSLIDQAESKTYAHAMTSSSPDPARPNGRKKGPQA